MTDNSGDLEILDFIVSRRPKSAVLYITRKSSTGKSCFHFLAWEGVYQSCAFNPELSVHFGQRNGIYYMPSRKHNSGPVLKIQAPYPPWNSAKGKNWMYDNSSVPAHLLCFMHCPLGIPVDGILPRQKHAVSGCRKWMDTWGWDSQGARKSPWEVPSHTWQHRLQGNPYV